MIAEMAVAVGVLYEHGWSHQKTIGPQQPKPTYQCPSIHHAQLKLAHHNPKTTQNIVPAALPATKSNGSF